MEDSGFGDGTQPACLPRLDFRAVKPVRPPLSPFLETSERHCRDSNLSPRPSPNETVLVRAICRYRSVESSPCLAVPRGSWPLHRSLQRVAGGQV